MSTQVQPNARLKAARKACGFTQMKMSDTLEIDCKTYRRWETGQMRPSLHNLEKLCRLLRKSREELGFSTT